MEAPRLDPQSETASRNRREGQEVSHEQGHRIRMILVGLYIALALMTLVFQISVRARGCAATGTCAASFAKAVVWSAIWPASWVAYLRGLV